MNMHTNMLQGTQLSPQQKRLWLLQEQNRSYRAQASVVIEGQLDPERLQRAVAQVVERQEILRTTFHRLPGMTIPIQVVNDQPAPTVARHDLRTLNVTEQAQRVEQLFAEAGQQPFDFEHGPLLRLALIALAPTRHVLLISMPALYGDTLTISNLVSEFDAAYQGNAPSDEEAGPQYADLAEIFNDLIEAEDTQEGRDYWQKQAIAPLLLAKLPFARQRRAGAAFQPETLPITINEQTAAQIGVFAEQQETSSSVVVLACWYSLLWQLTRQPELVVGVNYDGRTYEGLNEAIGLFARYIPLRLELAGDTPFQTLVSQLSALTQEVYEWQDYFTWELIERGSGAEPGVFPFSFDFAEQPRTHTAGELALTIERDATYVDRFQLKLSGAQHGDEVLTLALHYDAGLFTAGDVQRLGEQLATLIASVLAQPAAPIADLGLQSVAERQHVLVELNNTARSFSDFASVQQLFEAQAAQAPEVTALICESERLTYAELNARANQLAHYLRRHGVGPEQIVALCVDRSIEQIIGILGILKAGAAYVPLDPSFPPERLSFTLEDTQASLLLTKHNLLSESSRAAVETGRAQVVYLDRDWTQIAEERDDNPTILSDPEQLAYVIYTSGSTGKPKGVAIEQRQIVNYCRSIVERFELTAKMSFATVSTVAADLGNTVIYAALTTGGSLHVIVEERATNPAALASYFQAQPIDCLKIVPSHLNALLSHSEPAQVLPRSLLILGGEASSWDLITRVQQLAPTCRISNHYGPTETTVGVLTHAVTAAHTHYASATLPLGQPLANTQIYLLSPSLQPVAIGVPGAIYVGGAQLARGYLNRPEATAAAFIPHPFSETPGARLYTTGDLARYLPDGTIEFLGRGDDQVKIRGFRIELGEIAAALRQHEAVRDALVIAHESTSAAADKRIVAYVVADDTQTNASELQRFVATAVPEYMVPALVMLLDALPLTPNGKVDRKQLPAPDWQGATPRAEFVAPRTEVEAQLAAIWAEVLHLEQVGIYDNFFELGGDSILSIQIIAKANKAGLRLTPRDLFQHRTINELARVAGTALAMQHEQGLVEGPVPLTPIQTIFFEQALPERHHWNQALLLQTSGRLNREHLEAAMQHLLNHHDALRMRFIHESGARWQQINAAPDQTPVFVQIDLAAVAPAEQAAGLEAEATAIQSSLDLTNGPLIRGAIFDLGPQEPERLLLVIHHLVVDGVSWRVLLEDLQTAYQQLSQGQPVTLPLKTTSFKHWAERLNSYAQSEPLDQELPYWLRAGSAAAALPKDGPVDEAARRVGAARNVDVTLSAEETQALLQRVPAAYHTQINDVLLTALAQAFQRWTGSHALTIALEGHGRENLFEDVDLSRTVGWFSSLFPVRIELPGGDDPGAALRSVKEQLRGIPNNGIGYGLLRQLRQNDERAAPLRAQALPEIVFNYLGQFDGVAADTSFVPAPEPMGPQRSLNGTRRHLLDINGHIMAGQLHVTWTYSEQIHQRATIERLAQQFLESLQSLIAHCLAPDAGGYTPSDFPDEDLTDADLDAILDQIG